MERSNQLNARQLLQILNQNTALLRANFSRNLSIILHVKRSSVKLTYTKQILTCAKLLSFKFRNNMRKLLFHRNPEVSIV